MFTKWKTKDGKELLIKDMSTKHIKNCIKAIKEDRVHVGVHLDVGYTGDGDGDGVIYQWIDYGNEYIEAFKDELKRRGESI